MSENVALFAVNPFQSLKGIIGYCNFCIRDRFMNKCFVSIPERDYRLLQQLFLLLLRMIFKHVSIPERDYRLLQRLDAHSLVLLTQGKFQSLKGIIGYCNQHKIFNLALNSSVFRFQSLKGIIGYCNQVSKGDQLTSHLGFNP